MRVAGRAVVAALAALVAGLAISWVVIAAVRAATPEAGLLWRVAPPSKVAVWVLAGAHGATLHVEAGAEITDERIGRIGERIGELFGRDDPLSQVPSADLEVQVATLLILAIVGIVIALGMRYAGAGAAGLGDAIVGSALAAGTYGVGLAALAYASGARLGFEGRIVTAGVEASVSTVPALVLGTFWAGAFALIGALSAPEMARRLSPAVRAIAAGLRRAGTVAAVAATGCLILLAFTRLSGTNGFGELPEGLPVFGALLLALNVIAIAVVLAHGPTMTLSFDAGPFAEWSRLGYVSEGARSLPAMRWAFLLVPAFAGLAAGRVMRSRGVGLASAATGFGAAWGIVLAGLAVLLRVEVLSSFSIGSLAAGGGADIDPVLALLSGFVWGSVTSAIGHTAFGEPRGSTPTPGFPEPARSLVPARVCPSCGAAVPAGDRFCAACGGTVAST